MPAISARFTADVSDFRAKIATAVTEVTGFSRTASQVNNELRRFGNEFSGANVIRAAESMVKAVSDIGGVTKLTESEQRKLNAAVTEAIAKYDALGQQAPDSLRVLKDETEKATKAAKDIGGGVKESEGSLLSFKGVAGTIGGVVAGAFTVGAVVDFAKEVIELGGRINDLSERTGIGTDAIQELKYAAESTGSSIESVVGSIEKMSIKLVESSDNTLRAVRDLGLSIDDLRGMRPEDAYTAIADAVSEIENPMRQVELATELMGKAAAENLPAIKAGLSDLRQEARDLGQVMSEDAVKGLDTLGSTWDVFIGRAKAGVGELISDIQKAAKVLEGLGPKSAPGKVDRFSVGSAGEEQRRLAAELEKREREIQQKLDSVGAPSSFRPQFAPNSTGGFTPDTPSFEEQERSSRAQMAAAEAAIAHARAVTALGDAWRSADLTKQIQLQGQAFATLTAQERAHPDIIKKVVEEYGKLRVHVGANALPRDLEAFYQAHLPVIRGTRELIDVTNRYATWTLPDLSKRAQEARNMLVGLTAEGVIPTSRSFADLSTQMNVPAPVGLVNIGAQVTTNRELMSEWERDTRRVLTNVRQDFSFTFAEMLTGQVGWKDGALGIWDSFKRGVTDILGSILDSFINSFLKGITNALLGESGGWGQIFNNAFSGGGGGGGTNVTGGVTNNLTNRAVNWGLGALGIGGVGTVAGTTSLAGVSGTASIAGGIGGGSFTGLSTGAGAGAGGTFGGLSVAGVLGGAAAGGAGLGLGFLGQEIFGGAGWKAAGFGAGTGAATGALIGSVVPGIGTAVGAIVGGLAGAIGGWIGESVGEKVNNARDEFLFQKDAQGRQVFGGAGFGEGSAFLNLSTDLAKVQGGDKLFTNLLKADDFKELNSAVKAIVETLQGAEFNTIKVREGFDALTKQREALIALGADENAVLETQAGSYSLLFDTIKKTGAETPEALLPIFKSLIDMGLLVDENGGKVTSLADIAFGRLTAAAGKFGTDTAAAFVEVSRQLDEFVEKGFLSAEQADEMRSKFKGIEEGAEAVEGTTDEVQKLTDKVIISRDRAEELRKQLLEQENAHTTIEGSEQRIRDLTDALADAERQAAEFQAALERAGSVPPPSAPTFDPSDGVSPSLPGAAHGIYAWGPTPAIFGEGGEPELGGSVGFMKKALTGALREVSLDDLVRANYRSAPSSDRPIYLVADGMMLARVTNKYQPSALRLQGGIR